MMGGILQNFMKQVLKQEEDKTIMENQKARYNLRSRESLQRPNYHEVMQVDELVNAIAPETFNDAMEIPSAAVDCLP